MDDDLEIRLRTILIDPKASPVDAAQSGGSGREITRAQAFGMGRLACRPFAPLALAAAGGFLLSGRSASPNAVTAQASPAAQQNHPTRSIMRRNIADRFPGATLLGEAEFASAIVGGVFRYREVGSNLIVERPKEVFAEGGQYRIHGLRTISHGTYSVERGIVSIDCADCRYAFLGLSRERIFFRRQGMLFTANADGGGRVVELIREP